MPRPSTHPLGMRLDLRSVLAFLCIQVVQLMIWMCSRVENHKAFLCQTPDLWVYYSLCSQSFPPQLLSLLFLHSCKTKAVVGRTGNEARFY